MHIGCPVPCKLHVMVTQFGDEGLVNIFEFLQLDLDELAESVEALVSLGLVGVLDPVLEILGYALAGLDDIFPERAEAPEVLREPLLDRLEADDEEVL